MDHPNMSTWEAAWRDESPEGLGSCYAENAVVLHPKKPLIRGRAAIAAFFGGGMGRINLSFHVERLIVDSGSAFEYGEFRDLNRETGAVVASGQYVVTWTLEDGEWKILCHGWNSIA